MTEQETTQNSRTSPVVDFSQSYNQLTWGVLPKTFEGHYKGVTGRLFSLDPELILLSDSERLDLTDADGILRRGVLFLELLLGREVSGEEIWYASEQFSEGVEVHIKTNEGVFIIGQMKFLGKRSWTYIKRQGEENLIDGIKALVFPRDGGQICMTGDNELIFIQEAKTNLLTRINVFSRAIRYVCEQKNISLEIEEVLLHVNEFLQYGVVEVSGTKIYATGGAMLGWGFVYTDGTQGVPFAVVRQAESEWNGEKVEVDSLRPKLEVVEPMNGVLGTNEMIFRAAVYQLSQLFLSMGIEDVIRGDVLEYDTRNGRMVFGDYVVTRSQREEFDFEIGRIDGSPISPNKVKSMHFKVNGNWMIVPPTN